MACDWLYANFPLQLKFFNLHERRDFGVYCYLRNRYFITLWVFLVSFVQIKSLSNALLHFLTQSDVSNNTSISFLLIGLRDNVMQIFVS